ncbi:hypothetical protein OKW35_003435 [Paraburkholderia sp. MM5477-R1]
MAQIHRDTVVPVARGELADFVPVVVAGVVDEHVDRARRIDDCGEGVFDRFDIFQVAAAEQRRMLRVAKRFLQRERIVLGDVEEEHARALLRERLDDRGADPAAAAGHDDGFVRQTWIGCVRHQIFHLLRVGPHTGRRSPP